MGDKIDKRRGRPASSVRYSAAIVAVLALIGAARADDGAASSRQRS